MAESLDLSGLALKIRRLVEERGWNQEEFARIARINRHTARQILLPGPQRKLRNATVLSCARAFGLSVSDLRDQPLEKLLARMTATTTHPVDVVRLRFQQASHPDLRAWIERNPDRARALEDPDFDELLTLQDNLGSLGVDGIVSRLERRRTLLERVATIARTEYLDLLEQIVTLILEKVSPRGEQS
jgi:transcriptional regulator with XRE-family HTH domain